MMADDDPCLFEAEQNVSEEKAWNTPPFSDAVYKEISKINGKINQMNKPDIISKLHKLKLSTEGNGDVLKKRLKCYYKEKKLTSANILTVCKLHPYYVIVDFEATCDGENRANYQHEIIEFPAVLVDTKKLQTVGHFQAYCKPVINPKLSQFCVDLTGITQEQVDGAKPFAQVLEEFESWLSIHNLDRKHNYVIVTDGPWDMGRFLYGQCKILDLPYPKCAYTWVNIRRIFSTFYKCKRLSLKTMLDYLGMEFEGRPHCGLDDAKNIARILLRLISDGASIQVNERINLKTKTQKANFYWCGAVIPLNSDESSKNNKQVMRERSIREHCKKLLLEEEAQKSSKKNQTREPTDAVPKTRAQTHRRRKNT